MFFKLCGMAFVTFSFENRFEQRNVKSKASPCLLILVRNLIPIRMAAVLIILKFLIVTSSAVPSRATTDLGHEEAYVRLTYPTHPDIQLELYQKARIHKNGGPILPKPIPFRKPSFVITSFQADLHRPAEGEASSAAPSYVIKPFKAQLFNHVQSFTPNGRPTLGNTQLPLPGPIEVAVAEGESVREKVRMPLVIEANSRRRHFSALNSSQHQSTSYNKFSEDLTTQQSNDGHKTGNYSSNFTLPPYPLSKIGTSTSPNEIERNKTTETTTRQRPDKTEAIHSLLKQFLEATRYYHSTEDDLDSRKPETQEDIRLTNNFYSKFFKNVTSKERLDQSEEVTSNPQFIPLSSLVFERSGSLEPITSTSPTTYSPIKFSTLAPIQTGEKNALLENEQESIREAEKPVSEEEFQTTTFETVEKRTHQMPQISSSNDVYLSNSKFNVTPLRQDAEIMGNLSVHHVKGGVVMSDSYGGFRIFSTNTSTSNTAETSDSEDAPLNVTNLAESSQRPLHLPVALDTDALSESLKASVLFNETYREKVVKIASLYVAELIANVMSLTHHHTTPKPSTASLNGAHREEKVVEQTKVEGEAIKETDAEKLKVEGNEATVRPEFPKEKKKKPSTTAVKTETILRTAHNPVAGGRPVFIVEAKTSYVFPTDTPLPSNYEQVHRQEYYTIMESDEDYDSRELPTHNPTPFHLIKG